MVPMPNDEMLHLMKCSPQTAFQLSREAEQTQQQLKGNISG